MVLMMVTGSVNVAHFEQNAPRARWGLWILLIQAPPLMYPSLVQVVQGLSGQWGLPSLSQMTPSFLVTTIALLDPVSALGTLSARITPPLITPAALNIPRLLDWHQG